MSYISLKDLVRDHKRARAVPATKEEINILVLVPSRILEDY
jgi:hypothetical protein